MQNFILKLVFHQMDWNLLKLSVYPTPTEFMQLKY